ncbi:hypothetical protein [Streptomyces cupreus]|uniref:Uncharacterized protein n=1 Tax=Streptomyces cupreus TaxID=2759956 RepID=A0A7X1ME32_9ACTN|nr:hypothetical protein [Streptomyces cupreus]MBC2907538.1 hypothetical protein [Streptomyces cupreus]
MSARGPWCGRELPLGLGIDVLRHLGEETGAVIRDGFGERLYWLIPPSRDRE